MEEREGTNNNNISSSFGLKQHEAPLPPPPGFRRDPPQSENPNPFPVGPSSISASTAVVNASENPAPPFSLTMPVENSSSELKKKRGRPRKYNPDGSLAVTLSPMPISSSVPLTSEFGSRKRGRGRGRSRGKGRGQGQGEGERQGRGEGERQGRGEGVGEPNSNNWLKNTQMVEFVNSSGGGPAEFVSRSFTPHVLTVNAGEDVTMKIMTFSQEDSRAICILSANGPISNVTLRQCMTSGGTLTFEGHFEILSLTGSFIPSESGGTRSRAGGMSVSLAEPDGRVFGGGLAGLFIAAGPVQVMVATFIAGQEQSQPQPQQQQKQQQQMKKHRKERLGISTTIQPSNISFGGSAEDPKARYGINKPLVTQAPPVSFSHEPSSNPVHSHYSNNTANHIKDLFSSLPEDDEEEEGEEDIAGEEDEEEYEDHSESDTEVLN